MITTENEVMLASDYKVNYYGKVLEVSRYTKVLALFVNGGGYTGDHGYYYGSEDYNLFITDKENFGETLIQVGKGTSQYHGNKRRCCFTLNGVETSIDGLTIDEIFTSVNKK